MKEIWFEKLWITAGREIKNRVDHSRRFVTIFQNSQRRNFTKKDKRNEGNAVEKGFGDTNSLQERVNTTFGVLKVVPWKTNFQLRSVKCEFNSRDSVYSRVEVNTTLNAFLSSELLHPLHVDKRWAELFLQSFWKRTISTQIEQQFHFPTPHGYTPLS